MIAGSHLIVRLEILLIYNCTALKTSKQTYCSAKEHYRGSMQKKFSQPVGNCALIYAKAYYGRGSAE